MPIGLIRQDMRGTYIMLDGQRYRHGPLYLPRPAMRHDDGGLKSGEKVRFRRIPCAPAIVISIPCGGETVWETEDCKDAETKRSSALPHEDAAAVLGGTVIGSVTRIET